jgi:hypothetical protein
VRVDGLQIVDGVLDIVGLAGCLARLLDEVADGCLGSGNRGFVCDYVFTTARFGLKRVSQAYGADGWLLAASPRTIAVSLLSPKFAFSRRLSAYREGECRGRCHGAL